MNYAVEMGSGAMIFITKFHKDWVSHSEVDRGIHRHTDPDMLIQRLHGDCISLLLLSKTKTSRLK
jgi:hypothetical protein